MMRLVHAREDCPNVNHNDEIITDSDELDDVTCPLCGPDGPDRCPACGEVIDNCQGHGKIGDPDGAHVLESHDGGQHSLCHPAAGCES